MSSKSKRGPKAPAPEDDLPGGTVAVAYVHKYEIEYSFHHSIVQMVLYDLATNMRVARGGFVVRRGTTGDLARDRNFGVVDFLNDPRQADWLLWVDTDMGFEPDAIERLVASADPVERPVMGGLCFAQREEEDDGVGGYRPVAWPVLMDWDVVNQQGGFSVRWDYPRNAVTQCHGIGSAFVLIHRSVFERIRDRWEAAEVAAGRRKDGDPRWAAWYSRIINPSTGELAGEDLSFCIRLMMAEIPVHVDTSVQTTHRKNIWLQEQDYWRQRALAPAPETVVNLPREKWAVPRFAIVPTHNRPERLKALVRSLGAQCNHIIVLDNASEPAVDKAALEAVAGDASVTVLRDPEQPPNLSRFWNVMFDAVAAWVDHSDQEAWDVAVFNDDAIVPAGWYDICSTVLRGHGTAAVAHTGAQPVHGHELVDAYPYPREKRMCPWAFVVKGELGLRADENLRWWYQDDDFCRSAIDAGGVLAAPGPLVINAHAVQSTTGVLAEQAERDRATFEAKWAGQL
jgi:hypothetical protein